MPRVMKPSPSGTDVQKTVDRSTFVQAGCLNQRRAEPEIGEERHEDHKRHDDARDPELRRDQ